jgi:hypothetical protein
MEREQIYVIDWDKVKTVSDIKEILMGLGITIDVSKFPKDSKLNKYLTKMES